jgi:dihydroorotate dehydrogenase
VFGKLRTFSTALPPEQIIARERTLSLIERAPEFRQSNGALRASNASSMLDNHPDPETAIKIRQQMEEISVLIERMNKREEAGNRVIIMAASAFLMTSLGYILFQFSDVNTAFTSSLPSIFTFFKYSTARKFLCRLASWDLLPVDFGSEDPYLIRVIDVRDRHPKTRALRICIPVGLGAGIDVDSKGPASFLKFGFGSIEVGNVSINPRQSSGEDDIQILGSTIASNSSRVEGSAGLSIVSDRFCRYLQNRPSDLLTRNTVCGISIEVKGAADIKRVFSDERLIQLADYISLDVSRLDIDSILKVVKQLDEESKHVDSIPPLLLKVNLPQSLPPSAELVDCVLKSKAVVGVNINGIGIAGHNNHISNFQSDGDIHVSGQIVKEKSTEAVGNWFKALGARTNKKVVFASGGVFSGRDALEKIEAGASLVNVYSAFIIDGPPVARRIKTQLSVQLMNKGYYDLHEVVGAKHYIVSQRLKETMRRRKRF